MPQNQKAAKKAAEVPPTEPIDVDPPAEDPEAVVENAVATDNEVVHTTALLDFKRSGPKYDLSILDKLIKQGRGDLVPHRDAISSAVNEADNRSELVGQFKEDFEKKNVLNMSVLTEAVNNHQVIAQDLRAQLWKTIKALPQS